MSRGMVMRLAAAGLLLAACCLLGACGRKGPLKPASTSLPTAPADLQLAQKGEDFLLSWALPEKNQDGSPADDLFAFRVYRLVFDAAQGCPSCQDPDEVVAEILLRRPEPAVRLGKRLYWRDQLVAPGTGHAYLVVPVTIGGYEGGAAGIHRVRVVAPAAPGSPLAAAADGAIRLDWTPPGELPAGARLLGYNIYRRAPETPYTPVPLNRQPLAEPYLVDRVGEGGGVALYRVTAVAENGGLIVESAPSAEVGITPGR